MRRTGRMMKTGMNDKATGQRERFSVRGRTNGELSKENFLLPGWPTLSPESALLGVGRKLTKFLLLKVTEVEMKATVLRFTAILAVVMAVTASAYAQGMTAKRSNFVVPFEFKV